MNANRMRTKSEIGRIPRVSLSVRSFGGGRGVVFSHCVVGDFARRSYFDHMTNISTKKTYPCLHPVCHGLDPLLTICRSILTPGTACP
jgi:hypothetical protein